jgi:N-acetylmuramoyl-L-alanine amidase
MTAFNKTLILAFALLLLFPYQAFAYKVVIDAGHGGKDPGAIGVNGLQEKDVNLDIALKLRDDLKQAGNEVVMTRVDDHFLSLGERVDLTNTQQADLFVSIHANSYSRPATRGTMVLYYDDAYPQEDYPASNRMKALTSFSKSLAQGVLDSLVKQAGTVNQGLTPSAVYVTRMGSIPSILVETAFLSNAQDAAMLANDEFRKQLASGIAQGIATFTPPVFVDTVGHWARDIILRMKDKGWVEGVNNRYEPERALTRAEFLTLMDRVFQISTLQAPCDTKGPSVTNSVYGCKSIVNDAYKDLPASHWASAVFAKAGKINLLQGYSDGTIRPDQPITRAEVAVLFQRLLNASPIIMNTNALLFSSRIFADVPHDLWFAESVYALASKGVIDGVTADEYMPNRLMTRAEIAAMMDRYAAAHF